MPKRIFFTTIIFLLISSVFFIFTANAFASEGVYVVSGASTTTANGVYTENGTWYGHPAYENSNGQAWIFYCSDFNDWAINSVKTTTAPIWYGTDSGTGIDSTFWANSVAGPNPTVTAGSTYTITYDSNSATSGTTPSNQTKTTGVNITLSVNTGTLVKIGYTFSGWNTQSDGKGAHYSEGGTFSTDANSTLYAEWTDATNPTVTISSPNNSSVTNNSSVSFSASGSDTNLSSLISNLDSSLVYWWTMNDNAYNKTIADYIANNNGTAQQNTSVLHSYGQNGGALTFNGTSDYVSISDSTSLKPSTITVSAWVKFNSLTSSTQCGTAPSSQEYIVFKRNSLTGSDFEGYNLLEQSGNLYFVVSSPDQHQDFAVSKTSITTGGWHHVVGVFQKPNILLYLDGVQGTSGTHNYDLDSSTRPVFLGRSGECDGPGEGNYDAYLNGSLDDVQIYNRALAADEITALYNGTAVSHNSTLADGNHTYQVYAEDLAGNIGTSTNTLLVDTVAPLVDAGSDQSKSISFTQTATASDLGSGINASTYQWIKTSGPGTVTFGSANALSTTISADTNGTYVISFSASDNAGNSVSDSFTLTWTNPICSSIVNAATYNSFPTCGVVTCNSGYIVSNGQCVAVRDHSASLAIFTLPAVPSNGFQILINNGAKTTNSQNVTLTFNAGSDIKNMTISNTQDFYSSSKQAYITPTQWKLLPGDSLKTVYVKFYTQWGQSSKVMSASINLSSNVFKFKNNLKIGDIRKDVYQLQVFLNTHGFMIATSGVGSPSHETTKFGLATYTALRNFQHANKILSSGWFGPVTRAFINNSQ